MTAYLAAELRAQKARLKLSDEEISRRTEGAVSKATVTRYLAGKTAIAAEAFVAMATALGKDPGTLITEAAENVRSQLEH